MSLPYTVRLSRLAAPGIGGTRPYKVWPCTDPVPRFTDITSCSKLHFAYLSKRSFRTFLKRALLKNWKPWKKISNSRVFSTVGANYLGEILEWAGFALATGGALPVVSFAVFTICNIGPRAFHHHAWYLKTFGDKYPKHRKALIPFIC